jgi:hypothetical protein
MAKSKSRWFRDNKANGEEQQGADKMVPFTHDDDAEAARLNAAAAGAQAGRAGISKDEIADEAGPFQRLFTERAKAAAERARAKVLRGLHDLEEVAGTVVLSAEEVKERDALLAKDEQAARAAAERRRKEAAKAKDELDGLTTLERGLIRPEAETISTAILGAADVVTLGLYLSERAAMPAQSAWLAAVLAGLGAATAGWVAGRGVLASSDDPRTRGRAILAIAGFIFLCAVWFVLSMHDMRDEDAKLGVAASIKFGSPLCALTLTGASMVSFVGGGGRPGFDLRDARAYALTEAVVAEGLAEEKRRLRHQLRTLKAEAAGLQAALKEHKEHLLAAAEHDAAAADHEGLARWGLFGSYAEMYRVSGEHDLEDLETIKGLRAREAKWTRELNRRARAINLLLAAVGGGLAALAAAVAGAPEQLLVLAAGVGGALAVWRAPGALVIVEREEVRSPLEELIRSSSSTKLHDNGNGARQHGEGQEEASR